ncbi:LysR family transcriptional regulator [Roseateles sp. BYS96W]|uniref:LysR family transcriptional regulator n=1 Tax=Pelomonas nitida TaxID=3299027 RepID=A0ABW7GC81_9BURK
MPINELRSISTFAKAVELGSIRRAAQSLGVTPQAASQTIAQLEDHLGVRLLHRTTRSLALTDEGQRLLEATRPALAELQRALDQARQSQDEIAGPLRIVGPRSTFAGILMPVLEEFCRMYPDVQPDVQLDDGISNWVMDRVDVGFRIGASADEGVIARRLFPVQLLICASPEYLQQHGVPASLEDLSNHRCSAFRHPATGQVLAWYLNIDGEIVHRHVVPALSTNDTELEVLAVLAGQAVGQIANLSAAAYIRAGRLVPVLTQHISEHIGVHLYYGNRTAQPKRVRAFIDLAIQRLLDTPAFVLSASEIRQAAAVKGRARQR